MKRKSPAKNLVERLGSAKWEFLKRNPEKFQAFRNKYSEYIKAGDDAKNEVCEADRLLDKLADHGFSVDGMRAKFAKIIQALEEENRLRSLIQTPAAANANKALKFACIAERAAKKGRNKPRLPYTHYAQLDEANQRQYREDILNNAKEIMSALIGNFPSQKLLIVVDLNWTKEAIKAQAGELIDIEHQWYSQKKNGRTGKQTRAKWLSVVPELLEVWDLYNAAGKRPASRTFAQIAAKVDRPLSTVKGQWRLAYQQIYEKPYDPEVKYSNDDKLTAATQLCAKCPYGAKCYRSGDWFPCTDYLAISGKERNIKTAEYNENILYDDDIDA